VRLEVVSMGMRRIRIADLPPEVPEKTLRMALVPSGDIVSIHEETWPTAYLYTNGIKFITMKLNKQFPSHMNIAENGILASYEDQPVTY